MVTNKLRVGKTEIISKFNCLKCDTQLKESTYSLSKTGMVVCENTVGEFNTPCLSKFSFTYCGACRKVGLTKFMRFTERQIVGMRRKVRCHVCENGKLSSIFCRFIPHTKQVTFDNKGNAIINPPDENKDVMGGLIKHWENDNKFTPDMIGKGEVDSSNLTHIPTSFWKSSISVEGHEEVLSQPYCDRCSEILMELPDGSMVTDYSHVCPKCGVYFRVNQEGVAAK